MNQKPPKKSSLIVAITGIATLSLGYAVMKPSRTAAFEQNQLIEGAKSSDAAIASHASTAPEYAFDDGGFFCLRLTDAEEMNKKLYYTKEYDSLVYLIKSDRCVLMKLIDKSKITNVGLLDVYDLDNPNKDMCKVRVHIGDVVTEVWAPCMALLKDGTEPYAEQVNGGAYGWGGTW